MSTKTYRNKLDKLGHSEDFSAGSENKTYIDQQLEITGVTTFKGRSAFPQYQIIEDYQTRTISSDVDVVLLSGSGTSRNAKIKDNGSIIVELPTGGSLVDGQIIEILCVGDTGTTPERVGYTHFRGTFLSASNTNLVGPGNKGYWFAGSGSGATCRYRSSDPSTSGSVNPIWDVRLFGTGSWLA
tara:strand:- start:192 stop:743 length:552 start_codon:yes stop_codon:yes gene_type:complete